MLRQRQARQVLGAMGPQLLVRYQQATTVEHRSTSGASRTHRRRHRQPRQQEPARGFWVAENSLLRGGPNIIFAKAEGANRLRGCALRLYYPLRFYFKLRE